jgi:hypothetical protein
MGDGSTTNRAVVQSAGEGFRLKARFMLDEFNRSGPAMQRLLRYTQALITQTSQTAACNRHHSLDQQLCRRLLPEPGSREVQRNWRHHELIGNMLGVRPRRA